MQVQYLQISFLKSGQLRPITSPNYAHETQDIKCYIYLTPMFDAIQIFFVFYLQYTVVPLLI
jgi:hypothetical protein